MLRKIHGGLFSLGFILFLALFAEATPNLNDLHHLENVTSSVRDGNLIFALQFSDSTPDFEEPLFYPRSIQLEFQNTYVKPSKRVFPSLGNDIASVFVAQYNPKTVRVRFMLVEEGVDLRKKFNIRRLGQLLQIEFKQSQNDLMDRLMDEISTQEKPVTRPGETGLPSATFLSNKVNSSDEKGATSKNPDSSLPTVSILSKDNDPDDLDFFLSKRVIRSTDILPVNSEGKPEQKQALSEEKKLPMLRTPPIKRSRTNVSFGSGDEGPPDLMDSAIKMFSMLALVLGVMFIALYVLKKLVIKNGVFGNTGQLINVLGSGMLAPRKNVTLVEVAGDILVLGVSQDQITLLATIDDEEKIRKIKETFSSKVPKLEEDGIRTRVEEQSTAFRKPPKSAEVLAKYIKSFKENSAKPVKQTSDSAARVNALIKKKLGALRTA